MSPTDSILLQLEHQDRTCSRPHGQTSSIAHTLWNSFGKKDPRAQESVPLDPVAYVLYEVARTSLLVWFSLPEIIKSDYCT